jgi:hypothetical protein
MLPLAAAALTPFVKSLFEGGLTLLGNAVLAKGKDAVEQTLGVKLPADDQSLTGEQLIQMRTLEFDNEQSLREFALAKAEQDLKGTAMEHANTAGARQMNIAIQESANASTLAKNLAYLLDIGIVAGTVLLIMLLYFQAIPVANKDIAYMALGSLLTMCGTVVNFHRGSSAGSKSKDDSTAKLIDAIGGRK